MGRGKHVTVLLLDLVAAFDTSDFDFMLYTLYTLGFRGNIFKWLRMHQCDRRFAVGTEGLFSSEIGLDAGIPQGSML
ncbi:hypothetical protein HHI36_006903, partial [Cryptolaemus montrouzieri]